MPENLENQTICRKCVGESYLSSEINSLGKVRKCHYCGGKRRCFTLAQMAERIEAAFEQHYVWTSSEPADWEYGLMRDSESDYEWEREGEPTEEAIRDATEVPEAAAADLQQLLEEKYFDRDSAKCGEETPFSAQAHYTDRPWDVRVWRERWQAFELSLQTEARFFNRSAYDLLESTFRGLEKMRTRNNRSIIVSAGPGTNLTEIYRARCCQSDEELKTVLALPDRELGPPPPHLARAGRMNAEGISVFYGANGPETAITEVRPPVGSRVTVARFEILRRLHLLDLQALKEMVCHGSIFDPNFADRGERAVFLRSLNELLASPVLPERERFEYLPTQAIADFLATENSPPLDGIIFPSVQSDGKALNMALFHKASKVEEYELPKGTKIEVALERHYEEGPEEEYQVTEELPPETQPLDRRISDHDFLLDAVSDLGTVPTSFLPVTLRIDLDSVRVHTIHAVSLAMHDEGVSRHQWRRQERPEF